MEIQINEIQSEGDGDDSELENDDSCDIIPKFQRPTRCLPSIDGVFSRKSLSEEWIQEEKENIVNIKSFSDRSL